jgi:septal ring factor EnvC (AmiA/AmiB activator)
MADPMQRLRERELERRRQNELKDLEVEEEHSERPLEGLSSAPTTWTREQNDAARALHEHDESESRRRSESQVPPAPPDRTLEP